MKTYCVRDGQTEIGIIEIEGREFAAMGASVHGNQLSGYTKEKNGEIVLTSWCGKTMLACRCEVLDEYQLETGEKPVALVYSLANGRFIIGYALERSGMLFRGELCPIGYTLDDARKDCWGLAEYWMEQDQEDEERYQAELAEEEGW